MPNRIREVREGAGLHLRELARQVGIDAGQLSRIEKGTQALSDHWLQKIADALGTKSWELLADWPHPVEAKVVLDGQKRVSTMTTNFDALVEEAAAQPRPRRRRAQSDRPPEKLVEIRVGNEPGYVVTIYYLSGVGGLQIETPDREKKK